MVLEPKSAKTLVLKTLVLHSTSQSTAILDTLEAKMGTPWTFYAITLLIYHVLHIPSSA